MLSRILEWYRIVNPKPSRDVIDRRTEAARDLVAMFDGVKGWDMIIAAANGVAGGFESGFTEDSDIVQATVVSIKKHDSAFPQDLCENAIELQVLTAVALGEFLVRKSKNKPDRFAIVIALILQSGFHLRSVTSCTFLEKMIAELTTASEEVLVRASLGLRDRSADIGDQIEKLIEASAAAVPNTEAVAAAEEEEEEVELEEEFNALQGAVLSTMVEFKRQSSIDREELNILWWMFAGASTTTGAMLVDLSSGALAMVCGSELGNLCLIPPPANLKAMVVRAFVSVLPTSEKTLSEIVLDWDPAIRSLLGGETKAIVVARKYPVLFPLTWLSDRLMASDGAAGWEDEFEQKTRVAPSAMFDLATIAVQVMRERIALRQDI